MLGRNHISSPAVARVVMTIAAIALLLTACSDDAPPAGAPATTAAPAASSTAAPAPSSTAGETGDSSEIGDTGEAVGRPSPGCEPSAGAAGPATPPATPQTVVESTDVAGRPRTHQVALPDDLDPTRAAPLIIGLHGALGSAAQFEESTGLAERGTDRGFVVVLPDAVAGSWDYGVEGPDDSFLIGLLDDVAATHCIDLDRVHLGGMSLGAWKSAVTACNNPGRFAALVLVTVEVHPEGCEPLSVLAVHGTSDHIAPYGEGGDGVEVIGALAALSGSRENVAAWAASAGCDAAWDEHRIEPDVVRWVYRACDSGLGVELYTIEGGDHAWPGSATDPAPTTDAVHATDLALDWFEAHPRQPTGR